MHDDPSEPNTPRSSPFPPDFAKEGQEPPPPAAAPSLSPSASEVPLPAPAETDADHPTLGGMFVGPPLIRGALLNSFKDGVFANGMLALQETFAIAAAVSLHASSMAIAFMTSLPLLLGSLGQFLLPALVDPARGRKYYVLHGVRGQATFFFVAAWTGFLPESVAPWAYAAAFVCAATSATATNVFWVDWMGDLIPGSVRGRHFAWRSVWFAWTYLSCSLLAGYLARSFPPATAPWGLFAIIFVAAASLRFVSLGFLRKQYEPVSHRVREAFSPLKFRPSRDFLKWCLATSTFGAAAAMSGPFFAVHFLRDLHFDYLTLAIALCSTVLGSVVFIRFWGRMADNFGTSKTIWVTGLLVSFIPVPYIFTTEPWLIWLFNFYSGATWAGYNMANFNHLLSATEKKQRSHYVAFTSLVGGVMGFAFTLLGGYLSTRLPPLQGYSICSLFLLSTVIRLSVCLLFYRGFREYREALPRKSEDVYLEIPGYRVGQGLFRNVFRGYRNQ